MNIGGARPDGGAVGADPSASSPPEPVRFPRLRAGDRVAVVAPSGIVDSGRLAAGCAALGDLGFQVTIGDHVLDQVDLSGAAGAAPSGSGPGLAGTDADRAADLQAAWTDPDVRAVVCARGGYGATRVLPHLDWDALAAAGPRALHGSSDITALHVAFGARLGVTTSFGPMVAGALADGGTEGARATREGFGDVLCEMRTVTLTGSRAIRPGRAQGRLTGGTLTLLASLVGTPDAPPSAEGRLVFLEDVAEAPYRVDRMLVQLERSGWLDGAAGFALGSWTGCGDAAELTAVFQARLAPFDVPVLSGLSVGHGGRQRTLELGARARLDATARTLTVPADATVSAPGPVETSR